MIRQSGEVISLSPVVEALRKLEVEASWPGSLTSAHARAEILDLLSEIDQLWLERRQDLYFALRLTAVASLGLLLAIVVDVDWLRLLALLVVAACLPGFLGLYDYFIGKPKEARRQRLEQALSAVWSTLDPAIGSADLQPSQQPASISTQLDSLHE
ncbi:MAG: hypothetical protein HY870_04615 [Chloroflexi bacterium]|nr:hypothetical protein [Chloroflexota bacterium]